MAQLLVTVKDPLDLAKPPGERRPLLLDAFVRVEMLGRRMEGLIRIPRDVLREGRRIWVMTRDGKLAVRAAKVRWTDEEYAYLSNRLGPGELLVLSDIDAPAPGMALRTAKTGKGRPPKPKGKAGLGAKPSKAAPPKAPAPVRDGRSPAKAEGGRG